MVMAITGDAPGAWPAGTRVRKKGSAVGDAHEDGALGTVRGSAGPMEYEGVEGYGYNVEWDDRPGIPIHIWSTRLEKENT